MPRWVVLNGMISLTRGTCSHVWVLKVRIEAKHPSVNRTGPPQPKVAWPSVSLCGGGAVLCATKPQCDDVPCKLLSVTGKGV